MAPTTTTTITEMHPKLAAFAARIAATAPKGRRGHPRECACGCKDENGNPGMTKGGTFRPGHDAKMLSRMISEIRSAK